MRTSRLVASLGILTLLAACGGGATPADNLSRHNTTDPTPGAPDTHNPNDPGDQNNGAPPTNPGGNPTNPTNPGTTSGSFDVAIDNATPTADLGGKVDIKVTVTPKAGFTGQANLTVTGLPAGATSAFSPASVTLNTTAVTSDLAITVPITTPTTAAAAMSALVITATSGSTTATANANFKVNAKMLVTVPLNYNALRQAGTRYVDNWGAALAGGGAIGATKTPLLTQTGNPIQVTVYNADSTPHIIHGQNGFAHGDTANPIPATSTEMQNGAPRIRNLNVGVNAQGYCHDGSQGSGASFQIQVNASP